MNEEKNKKTPKRQEDYFAPLDAGKNSWKTAPRKKETLLIFI